MKRRQRNSTFEIMKLMAVLLIIYSSALPYGATYVRGGTMISLSTLI